MSNPKYRISEKHFETHGVARLERDGHSRQDIQPRRGVYERSAIHLRKQPGSDMNPRRSDEHWLREPCCARTGAAPARVGN